MLRMFDSARRLRLLLVALTVASIGLITLDARNPTGGPLDALGGATRVVLGPVQRALSTVARPVGAFFSGLVQGGALRSRIERLELENAELRSLQEQFDDVLRENDELRREAGVPSRLGLRTTVASVVGVGPSNFERVVIIDKGRTDGLRIDMPVLGNGGLVGRIVRLGPDTADVLLMIDRQSSIASRLATNGELGTSNGKGAGTLELELLDSNARVSEGDRVVTSGYSGGLYPTGIPIGTVISAPEAGSNLTRKVTVRPAVDFSRLSFVFVVTGRAPLAEPTP